jgi:predicted CXXCH cytochrome family protein
MCERMQKEISAHRPVTGVVFLLTGVAFFLLTVSFLSLTTISAEESPCLGCHVEFKKAAKTVHPALMMGCETCHQAAAGMNHPDKKGSMKLTQDVPGLCMGCHDKSKFNGKVVHAPVAGGMCTSCHNPHQTDASKLLMSDQPDLCYNCHDKKIFTKKNVHAAVMMGCTTCHSPHASDVPKLLAKPVEALCPSCHATQATGRHIMQLPGGKGFHPIKGKPDAGNPGKQITCTSCHGPHSSEFPKLWPVGDICLRCHNF